MNACMWLVSAWKLGSSFSDSDVLALLLVVHCGPPLLRQTLRRPGFLTHLGVAIVGFVSSFCLPSFQTYLSLPDFVPPLLSLFFIASFAHFPLSPFTVCFRRWVMMPCLFIALGAAGFVPFACACSCIFFWWVLCVWLPHAAGSAGFTQLAGGGRWG